MFVNTPCTGRNMKQVSSSSSSTRRCWFLFTWFTMHGQMIEVAFRRLSIPQFTWWGYLGLFWFVLIYFSCIWFIKTSSLVIKVPYMPCCKKRSGLSVRQLFYIIQPVYSTLRLFCTLLHQKVRYRQKKLFINFVSWRSAAKIVLWYEIHYPSSCRCFVVCSCVTKYDFASLRVFIRWNWLYALSGKVACSLQFVYAVLRTS